MHACIQQQPQVDGAHVRRVLPVELEPFALKRLDVLELDRDTLLVIRGRVRVLHDGHEHGDEHPSHECDVGDEEDGNCRVRWPGLDARDVRVVQRVGEHRTPGVARRHAEEGRKGAKRSLEVGVARQPVPFVVVDDGAEQDHPKVRVREGEDEDPRGGVEDGGDRKDDGTQ